PPHCYGLVFLGLLLTEVVGLAADRSEVGLATGAATLLQNGVCLMVQHHLSLGFYAGANAPFSSFTWLPWLSWVMSSVAEHA
ncbi:hypothetical protein U1Q18_020283, partial [Sarracenia purpurea var. burkii]